MQLKELKKADLELFKGSENFYPHGFARFVVFTYTDGVRYVADNGGAYWLLDIIATGQAKIGHEPFQSWKLEVDLKTNKGKITCHDGNENFFLMVEQQIEFTDFPLDEITLWLCNEVLMLPGEY